MEHKNCRQLLSSLSDYVDGDLDDELCAEIERHAGSCENCRIVIDTLRRTVQLYNASSAQITLPEEARRRLLHRLQLDD